MKDEIFYTIEKLPMRKNWALCRTVHSRNGNTCQPVAYFKSEEIAKTARKELSV